MENFDYLYDKTFFEGSYSVEHFVEKELSYKSYNNAYIVPLQGEHSGVYREDKTFIVDSSLHNGYGVPLSPEKVSTQNFSEETVVYIGVLFNVWGHVLTDDISRFWFLKNETFMRNFAKCKLVYIKMSRGGIPENAIKLFKILGIDYSKLVELSDIAQYKEVIIPDECFFSDDKGINRYFTKEYKHLIQCVRAYADKHLNVDSTCEKLYFTYKKYGMGKGSIGEKKLEKFFKSQGYRIVSPEKYTFEEQLNMLANCHYFASTIGSCAHNLIFLPEHANVILIPRAHYLTGYQLALDDVVDLNINYIDSSLSVLVKRNTPWTGPHYYYVSENLLRFFNIDEPDDAKYYRKQLKDFRRYFRKGKLLNDLEDRYQPEYYTKQFAYCMGKHRTSNKLVKIYRKLRLRGPAKLRKMLRKIFK